METTRGKKGRFAPYGGYALNGKPTRVSVLIQEALRRSGWSMGKLAKAIGVTRSYMSRILSGHRLPRNFVLLLKISQATGIHLDILEESLLRDLADYKRFLRDSSRQEKSS